MLSIIQAKSQYISNIYSMILELAQYEGIRDKIKITALQLEHLLFCAQPNHFVGIALMDERLCGFVMFNYTHHNICVNVTQGIYIENLYVAPEVRGQGIGHALFNYVEQQAYVRNCSRIEWWVSRNNPAASQFYKKIGAIALSDWVIYKCDRSGINNLLETGGVY